VDFVRYHGPMTTISSRLFRTNTASDPALSPPCSSLTYRLQHSAAFLPNSIHARSNIGIFFGKIPKWNDPAIAGANKGVSAPANDIIVVHRSEGRGHNLHLTDYLSKMSDEVTTKVGKGAVRHGPWVGLGQKGNEGVAGMISRLRILSAY